MLAALVFRAARVPVAADLRSVPIREFDPMAEADRLRNAPGFAEKAAEACRRANAADLTDPAVKALDALTEASLREINDEEGT